MSDSSYQRAQREYDARMPYEGPSYEDASEYWRDLSAEELGFRASMSGPEIEGRVSELEAEALENDVTLGGAYVEALRIFADLEGGE